jgi:hypothetical protein
LKSTWFGSFSSGNTWRNQYLSGTVLGIPQ